MSGWGKDAFGGGGAYQQVLKEVDVPVLLDFDCERKLKRTRLGLDFVLHPSFVCAGGEEGKDSCKVRYLFYCNIIIYNDVFRVMEEVLWCVRWGIPGNWQGLCLGVLGVGRRTYLGSMSRSATSTSGSGRTP